MRWTDWEMQYIRIAVYHYVSSDKRASVREIATCLSYGVLRSRSAPAIRTRLQEELDFISRSDRHG